MNWTRTRSSRRPRSKRSSVRGSSSRASNTRSAYRQRHGTALPGWKDLEPPANQRSAAPSGGAFMHRVSTARVALLIVAVAVAFTAYVGHVHATQQALADMRAAREANQSLHLKHNRLKGAYDRKTGPSVIYERARALGLQESLTYGPAIPDHE